MINQENINFLSDKVWDCTSSIWSTQEFLVEEAINKARPNNLQDVDSEHFCATVVHPDTGKTIIQYKTLVNGPDPNLRETWKTIFGKEAGRLAQGDSKTKQRKKLVYM